MPIDISKLNPRGKLTHLVAKDLFLPGTDQIFNAHTGKFIGMVMNGQEIIINAQGEAEIKPNANIDPNQLKLF